MIYLITCVQTNTCKIGFSDNPEKRLSSLQTGNPYSLELMSIIEGGIENEYELHKIFEKERLQGEWFKYSQKIKDYFKVEEYWLISDSVIKMIFRMKKQDIRTFSYLLLNFNGSPYCMSMKLRKMISDEIKMCSSNVGFAINTLNDMGLIVFKGKEFMINPRYAFKGSQSNRSVQIRTMQNEGYIL